MGLKGELREISIGTIIQSLSQDDQEGTLRVQAEVGERLFSIEGAGQITLVIPGRHFRLGELLLRADVVDREELNEGLRHAKRRHLRIGDALVDLDIVERSEIEGVLRRKFREEFFELCLSQEGTFEFLFDEGPEVVLDGDGSYSKVSMNTSGLIMDAMRQIDEFEEMRRTIRSNEAIFMRKIGWRDEIDKLDISDDLREGIELIDGKRTVGEVARLYDRSRFELYEMIHELLERGLIRGLGPDEAIELALESELHEDPEQAIKYYDWAIFCDPSNLKFRLRHHELLQEAGRTGDLVHAAVEIAALEHEAGNLEEARSFYEEAKGHDPKNLEVLRGLHQVFRDLAEQEPTPTRAEAVLETGRVLAEEERRSGLFREALETIDPLLSEHPRETDLQLLRAELHDALREREAAVRQYEKVTRILEAEDEGLEDRIEIYRRLLALDGSRDDIRAKLEQAEAQGARRQRIAGRLRLAFAIAALLSILVLGYLTVYELPADGLYEAAAQLEAVGTVGALERAGDNYERIITDYPLASTADDAEEALRELGRDITGVRHLRSSDPLGEQLREAREHLRAHRRVRELERTGDLREAGEVLAGLARAGEEGVRIPVRVETRPPGTILEVDGEELGPAPRELSIPWGEEVTVRARRAGFEPVERTVPAEPSAGILLRLDPVVAFEVDLGAEVVELLGHRAGWVVARDVRGRLHGVRNGEVRWTRDLDPIVERPGPAVVGPDTLYMVTPDGQLVAIGLSSGYPRWSTSTVQGVEAPPLLLRGEILLVGGEGSVYRHVREDGRRLPPLEARTDPRAGLVGDAGLAAGQGFCLDGMRRTVVPLRDSPATPWPPAVTRDRVALAGPDGVVRAHHPPTGRVAWRTTTREPPAGGPVAAGRAFVVPTDEGRLVALARRDGSHLWASPSDAAISGPPRTVGDAVWAATSGGEALALDPETGRVHVRRSLGRITGPPVDAGEVVVYPVGSRLVGLAR